MYKLILLLSLFSLSHLQEVYSNNVKDESLAETSHSDMEPTANDLTLARCEDAPGSGSAAFNLTALNAAIDDGAGNTITWYADAALTIAVADPTEVVVVDGELYYAQVDDGTSTDVATITFTVNATEVTNLASTNATCSSFYGNLGICCRSISV